MYSWLTEHKIPLGSWIKTFVDFLNLHAQWLFDFISLVLGSLIEGRDGALRMVQGLFPPDLSGELLRSVGIAIVETLQISIAGLAFGAVGGFTLAVLIAGNVQAPRWPGAAHT